MALIRITRNAGATGATVPSASTTVEGKVRLATIAEAGAGTSESIAVTPAGLSDAIAGIVGGMEFKGAYDVGLGVPDLSNALKGDYYLVTNVRTNPTDTNDTKVLYGIEWAVGDHLVITEDMGGMVDNNKITKVDNSESISELGDLSDVTITSASSGDALVYDGSAWVDTALATVATSGSASDVTGLASVATSGAYGDLSGAPALSAVATSGAYSDLSGAPALSAVATSGSASDLTGLATVATSGAYSDLSGTPTLGTASALDVGTSANNVVQLDGSGALPAVDGSALTGIVADLSSSVLDDLSDVTITSASSGDALVHNGTAWVDTALATVATSGAYSDLSGTPTLGTASALDVGTSANNVVQLDGSGALPAVDGSALTGITADLSSSVLDDLSDVTITSASSGDALVYNGTAWVDTALATVATSGSASDLTGLATVATSGSASDLTGLATVATSGAYSDLSGTPALSTVATSGAYSDLSGTPTLGTASALDVGTSANNVVQLDGSGALPAVDGSALTGITADLSSSVLDDLSDVTITSASSGDALVYNGTAWVDTALATVATSGAYSDLSGTPALSTVATSGAYSDLSGTPTLGTASALDVGTSANNVVQLDGSGALPAVDGSALTGITADLSSSVLDDLSDVTITSASSGDALVHNGTAWVDTALATVATSGSASDLTGLATVATSGSAGDLTGLATVATSGAYSDLSGTPTLGTASALDVGTSANNVVQLDGSGALPAVDGSALTGITADLSTGSLGDLGDVTITSASSGDALVHNGTAWVDTALATVATTGDFTDLINAPTSTISGASFVTDTNALTLVAGTHYIISTATSSTKTLTLPSVSSDGDYIRVTNWGLGDLVVQVDQSSTDAYLLVGQSITQNGSVTIESKATVDLFGFSYTQGGTTYDPAWGVYFSSSIELNTKSFNTTGQLAYYDATNQELTAGDLGDLTFSFTPSNYDNTRGGTVTGNAVGDHFGGVDDALGLKANSADLALVATDGDLPALTDVTITTPSSGDALVYNGTAWVNDSVAYSDLSGTPTLGTASALDVGTGANNVVQLDGSGALPAVDGSALTNVTSSPSAPDVTTASPASTYTVSTHNGAEEIYILTPSANCTVTLPTASTAGSGFRYHFKNMSTNTLTLNDTIDGTSGFDLTVQYSAVTIISDGTSWYII